VEKIYYYPFNPYGTEGSIEDYPRILEAIYDLEFLEPPHQKYASHMSMCPAMKVHNQMTYVIRSPFDFKLFYDPQISNWYSESSPLANTLIIPSQDQKPYIQLGVFYLFWVAKKSNTQLWLHDAPLYMLEQLPTWYISSGMIPIGEYTRNTSLGLILKPNQTDIIIKRGQPLCSITFVGDQGIELIKEKPSPEVLKQNIKNNQKKFICPYTYSKKLFARWLGLKS
jgi:hypothetical protein